MGKLINHQGPLKLELFVGNVFPFVSLANAAAAAVFVSHPIRPDPIRGVAMRSKTSRSLQPVNSDSSYAKPATRV